MIDGFTPLSSGFRVFQEVLARCLAGEETGESDQALDGQTRGSRILAGFIAGGGMSNARHNTFLSRAR